MEEIDIALCKIINDLAFTHIMSLKDLRDGHIVSNILNRIDPSFFSLSTDLNNWTNAKREIENYLDEKGLSNQILDFDEALISNGTLEHLISAVLQVLAIYAAFNEKEWDSVTSKLDLIQKNSVLPIIEPMIADIIEELSNTPKNDEFKVLLLRLERQESEIGKLKQSLMLKDEDIQVKTREIEKLTANNKSLSTELEELHKLKGETIKQIEDFYSSKTDNFEDGELAKRLQKTIQDRDEMADRLFRLELLLNDKDNEIEKLTMIKDAYESNKVETEGFTEQVEYYKGLVKKFRTEVDLKDSKLNALEMVDKNLERLKAKIKEQSSLISTMKLEKINQGSKIKTLEQKLAAADERVDFIRQRSSNLFDSHRDLFTENTERTKLEEENDKLKRKISYLEKELGENEVNRLNAEMIEKDNQILTGRVKSLLLLNDTQGDNQMNRYDTDKLEHSLVVSKIGFPPIEEESKEGLFGMTSTLQDLRSECSINVQNKIDDESMDILYSVCMEYVRRNIMKDRLLLPTRDERQRDIFKQFNLTNLLSERQL